MNDQLLLVGANPQPIAAKRPIAVGERHSQLVGNVDQTRFDIGGNEFIVARVERIDDVDLGLLELLRLEPIANLAVAVAVAGVDFGCVDQVGDIGLGD